MQVKEGAEEFFLRGSNGRAVLLLHGYTGTPAEMRPLGDYLQQRGFTVLAVRLPGHGTSVKELETTTAGDWYREAENGCRRLLEEYGDVMVAGLSMGGLLAIRVAAKLPVKKAAFLSTPIFVTDKRRPFFPVLRFFIHYLPKRKKCYHEMDKYNLSYSVMPTRPLGSLFAMLDCCRDKLLQAITIPCLVLQSRTEHTVKPESARYIYDHLGTAPENKKLLWFDRSGHILTLDKERETVFASIADFFEGRIK